MDRSVREATENEPPGSFSVVVPAYSLLLGLVGLSVGRLATDLAGGHPRACRCCRSAG